MPGCFHSLVSRTTAGAWLALGLGLACLTGTLLTRMPVSAPAEAGDGTSAPAAFDPAASAWPRTVLRLWFLVPQILPHDH